MSVVYYKSPFGKSAKRLAARMGLEYHRVHSDRVSSGYEGVAWGCRIPGCLNGDVNVGKLYQLDIWHTTDLLTVPYQRSGVSEGHTLARAACHYGGSDFTGRSFQAQYFTKPIKSVNEYRLHVFRYKLCSGTPANYMVARVGWKVNVDPSLNKEVQGVPIRSRRFGWHLKYYNPNSTMAWVENNPNVDLMARWAISVLDWDFGAVDILKGVDGKYYLLEANSAPGLGDDATLECYSHRLEVILGR